VLLASTASEQERGALSLFYALGGLPFEERFNGLELLPTVAIGWPALENGAVHPVGSDQLFHLVDMPASG
jgi:uncharacterized membrane protein (DUF4010 family)